MGLNYLALLNTIAGLLPVAKNLLNVIGAAQGSVIPQVLDYAAQLVPVATTLIAAIENVRHETETTHPQVWAPIRDDWKETFQRAKDLGLA